MTSGTKRLNEDLLKEISDILSGRSGATSEMIMDSLKRTAEMLRAKQRADYWMTEPGQAELLKKVEERSRHPAEHPNGGLSLFPMDYTEDTKRMMESKASLSSATQQWDSGEWVEVELCADTGACDTVMPRKMCTKIPIQPSIQSINLIEYDVASGETIPNLGERRCVMWTEGASSERQINLQVADVHKPLLSLSRCADMGFESRFGRVAGALIDEETGEVIPLQRKGNLYVLKCWIKAAPFGRQEPR